MTGDYVKSIRKGLGMRTKLFSDLFGVSTAAVYRWEKHGAAEVTVDLPHARVLAMLANLKDSTSPDDLKRLGNIASNLTVTRGGLYALFSLMKAAYEG